MWRFLKKLLLFKVGQKASRGFAHAIGLGRVGTLVGVVGGVKYMRRHS